MTATRRWWVVGIIVAIVAMMVFAVIWSENPHLFVERSPSVVVTGIDRIVQLEGGTAGFISGNLSSGCNVCPLTIQAGTSHAIWIGTWWANATSVPGKTVVMSWIVFSPYPFNALAYAPPSPPAVYTWHDNETIGPGGDGSWTLVLTLVIPYSYSGLPGAGNITFFMNSTSE